MFHISIRVLLVAASVTTSAWAADPSDPAAPTRPLDHRSVFDTYRAGSAGAVGNWREANDAVGRQAGGHAHDHDSAVAASPDAHAGHAHGAQAAADPHAGYHGHMHGGAAGHDQHHHGGHGHDHGNAPTVSPDPHAAHGAAGAEATPHHCPHHETMRDHMHGGGSGTMKPGHGHGCHHDSKEGGHAHTH